MKQLKLARKYLACILFTLTAALFLSGCFVGGAAFSPEAAAQRAVLENPNPDMQTDPNTVQVLQRIQLNGRTLVMLSFRGNDKNLGASSCLFLYEVRQMPLGGWNTGSGGGGCISGEENPDETPLSISSGITSGGAGPVDPGFSTVNGQVFLPDIRTVQVTWKDGQVQQVEVINASYLAARTGQVEMMNVEGLNAENEIVFSHSRQVDPGKQRIEEEKNNAKP